MDEGKLEPLCKLQSMQLLWHQDHQEVTEIMATLHGFPGGNTYEDLPFLSNLFNQKTKESLDRSLQLCLASHSATSGYTDDSTGQVTNQPPLPSDGPDSSGFQTSLKCHPIHCQHLDLSGSLDGRFRHPNTNGCLFRGLVFGWVSSLEHFCPEAVQVILNNNRKDSIRKCYLAKWNMWTQQNHISRDIPVTSDYPLSSYPQDNGTFLQLTTG